MNFLSFLILPTFDLVMIVVMIESTGMFLALSDITGRKIEQRGPRREPAHRRPGHAGRQAAQHLPVHQLLAERGPGQRHPLLESGILLTAVAAVLLNLFFNGARGDTSGAIEAAKTAEAH